MGKTGHRSFSSNVANPLRGVSNRVGRFAYATIFDRRIRKIRFQGDRPAVKVEIMGPHNSSGRTLSEMKEIPRLSTILHRIPDTSLTAP